MKTFRINIVASYLRPDRAYYLRPIVINTLINFAYLYRLEYAISINHDFGGGVADLVYFRSTKATTVTRKAFNALVSTSLNSGLILFDEGLDVAGQLYKSLGQYPFPNNDYYKPLVHPVVEHHKVGGFVLEHLKEVYQEESKPKYHTSKTHS